jgi:hypothetical protein
MIGGGRDDQFFWEVQHFEYNDDRMRSSIGRHINIEKEEKTASFLVRKRSSSSSGIEAEVAGCREEKRSNERGK